MLLVHSCSHLLLCHCLNCFMEEFNGLMRHGHQHCFWSFMLCEALCRAPRRCAVHPGNVQGIQTLSRASISAELFGVPLLCTL